MRSIRLALITFALALLVALPLVANAAPAPVPVPGAGKSGIVGIDAMTATVFQQDQSSFSGLALRARVRGAAFTSNLELLPAFEYWQNTSRLGAFGIQTLRRDATLGASARWVFANTGWQPYAGAGFALHFLDDEVRAPRLGVQHATHALIKGGVSALGGIQFNMSNRLGSFLELEFHDVTQYRQLKFDTGLSWNL